MSSSRHGTSAPIPEGPSTQYLRFLAAEAFRDMFFGTRNFKYCPEGPKYPNTEHSSRAAVLGIVTVVFARCLTLGYLDP